MECIGSIFFEFHGCILKYGKVSPDAKDPQLSSNSHPSLPCTSESAMPTTPLIVQFILELIDLFFVPHNPVLLPDGKTVATAVISVIEVVQTVTTIVTVITIIKTAIIQELVFNEVLDDVSHLGYCLFTC